MELKDRSHALRLLPGADLKASIQKYTNEKGIKAGWIVTCVGSLVGYNIRYANAPGATKGNGHFEIVSLVGTLSQDGSHLHICVSDGTGNTIGGHLLDGCIVYTTAEIILNESLEFVFTRQDDGSTGWKELNITPTSM